MKYITINQKDIEKAGIQNTDSGSLIDELAFSVDQWTSNELFENNLGYEPSEPYEYDFEEDLFAHTKTHNELYELAHALIIGVDEIFFSEVTKSKLQAGAFTALNYPEKWAELLEAYTEDLKTNFVDGISQEYNEALQSEIDDYQKQQYKEWLNGDYSNYRGVVYEISKYFTSNNEGSYNENEYTFALDDEDIDNFKDEGYRSNQLKRALLDSIKTAGENRKAKERAKSEERRVENERLAKYKTERAKEEAEARKAKLEAMTL